MGMSPKMPRVIGFGLLAELNEFMAHSPKERQSVLDQWVDALDRRTPMLEALETDTAMAAQDRKDAVQELSSAQDEAVATVTAANDRAAEIIGAANQQAQSINKELVAKLARAGSDADTAAREAEERQTRGVAALKERQDAVKVREDAVEGLEKAAQVMALDAAAVKAEYEGLIKEISAVQSRASR